MRGLILLLAALPLVAVARPAGRLGSIAFQPCRLESPQRQGSLEAGCASFEVPESPGPGARTISIRLALIAARASKPAADPVLLLAGGPGQSAIEAYPVAHAALAPLLAHRNILLVEQRGTGESSPLKCPLPDWKNAQSESVQTASAQATACLARYEGKADPRWYSTDDYIEDLERVRSAAGLGKVNLVAGSYGTRVALEYLRRHPDAIRSAFIDSVVPPELALGQDHARNLEDALDAMVRRCVGDPACLGRYGDLGAELRALRAQAAKAPREVVIRHPRTGKPEKVPFDGAALGGVARLFAYAPETLSVLPYLIHEAAQGRPEPLLAQAELIYSSLPGQIAHGMELSVLCAEDADLLREDPADRDTLIGGAIVTYTQAQCRVWPHRQRAADFKQPVVSAVPVLLLSGQHDPVTPPRYADQVAKTLSNSRVLLAKGQGHTPMGAGCMPRLLREFFDDPRPAQLDARCLDALGDAPFFLDAQGPAP